MATRAVTVCIIITMLNEKSLQFRGIQLGVKAILCEWLLKRERVLFLYVGLIKVE